MRAAVFLAGLILALAGIVQTQPESNDNSLDVSPYILRRDLDTARNLSRVYAEEFGIGVHSNSAYLTIGLEKNFHYHFWYLHALENPQDAPFIIWMSGGPGVSSFTGLFGQIGPYYVTKDGQVKWRQTNWLYKYNLIVLDVPVGTGFSFDKPDAGPGHTAAEFPGHLAESFDQFFTLFPPNPNQEIYVVGEGYAAKQTIGFAHLMTTTTQQYSFKLSGVILASGFIDPVIQFRPAKLLYQTGVITSVGRDSIEKNLERFRILMTEQQYVKASSLLWNISIGIERGVDSIFNRESGIENSGNILRDKLRPEMASFTSFMNRRDVKHALHIDANKPFIGVNDYVPLRFIESGDYAQSATKELELILDADVKVLYFSGNMDPMMPSGPERDVAESLRWKCHDKFNQIYNRQLWRVNENDVNSAGYVKCACNFCKATVRNAGEYVASDEPIKALDLVNRFISNSGYGTYVHYE